MRLHRLSMSAIGPFAAQVDIEFARFGDSGLFLLEGPTGAGKSTVLDAITFALYGKLAQSSATPERLKSHHAPADAAPVVELVFETQSGLYRIRRSPSHEHPKKRGDGSTPVHMKVRLWRLSSADDPDGGELLSSSIGDTDDEITRAVGLTHAQFVQTVLLPQGEFASFLRASTNDKRALLQRLFGTELLARTQLELVEGRRVAEQLRASAAQSVNKAVHAFAGAVGLDEEQLAELVACSEAAERSAVLASVQRTNSTLVSAERATATQAAAAGAARLRAQQVEQLASELRRRHGQREALRVELGTLEAAEAQFAAERAELAAGERALQVVSAAESLAVAITRSEQAQDAMTAARSRLAKPLATASRTGLREACDERRTTVGALSAQLVRERDLISRRAEYELLTAQLTEQISLGRQVIAELAELPDRQTKLVTARDQAAAIAAERVSLVADRDRARARLVAAKQAVAAATAAAENQQLAQEVFEHAQAQRAQLETMQISWRAGVASELGLALQHGQECVVCGSVEHPRPARPAPGAVTREQVDSFENQVRQLDDEVERRRAELAAQRAELVELQLRADQLTPERAADKLFQTAAAVTAAQAAADQHRALDDELTQLNRRLRERTEQALQAAVAETRLLERSAAVATDIERDEAAIGQARADYPSVADRVAEMTAEIELIDAAGAANAEAENALEAAEHAGETFITALAAAEFTDQQDWRDARCSSSQLAQLRARIIRYDSDLAAVRGKLGTAELTDPALDVELPDLDEVAATVAAAASAEDEAARAHGAARDRLAAAVRHATLLERAIQQSSAVLAETAAAIRVGNLVAGLGENQLKMELTTYVLVRRFTEIVSAANSQLRRISEGRYELEHTGARSGNARSGLGLRVLDLHTGRPRDPGTLSGGETFYVSLSLALGLADIVRAESGGIDLGTLFIDEGFGSLDPEVLDQVLAVLDGLREGGRAVGVVSHVAELKARIADQIQVRRNADGSSRLLTTGG